MMDNMSTRSAASLALHPHPFLPSSSSASSSHSTNTMLTKKISKLLKTDLDNDRETLDALKGLSSFFGENNTITRRSLRSNIEKRSLSINEEFLASFGEMKRALDSLQSDVLSMDDCCHQMMVKLEATRAQNNDLLKETLRLKHETAAVKSKQIIADKFLERFQLKPEEVTVLRGSSNSHPDSIDKSFFLAIDRVKRIHEDAKLLLRSNHQTTAIEIMDSMSVYQEASYERLYRWTLNSLRTFNAESVEMSYLLYQAISYLREKPVLLQYCLDEYGTVRRAAVVRNFIDALTRGSSGGSQPIDLHSNDPVRYVGDILSWLHQSIASEKEQLQSLLRECNQQELDRNQLIPTSLSFITEAFSRPAKVRIEQILMSEPSSRQETGPISLYRVKSLLHFYKDTITRQLLPDSQLIYTLNELHILSNRMFLNSLNFHCCNKLGKRISGEFEVPLNDLSPTDSFFKTVALLQQLFACFEASPVSDEKDDIRKILDIVIDPLLKSSRICGSKLGPIEMAVFMVNSLHALVSGLSDGKLSKDLRDALDIQMDQHLETLVNEQGLHIISHLGMSSLYNAVLQEDLKAPLSSLAGCDSLALQTCSKNLDSFLASPGIAFLPQLQMINSGPIRERVRNEAINMFSSIYKRIFDAIKTPSNGYGDGSNLLQQTCDQIKSLLL